MKYPEYYDAILGRHEPRISDYALEKVAYKEAVFQIWCGHKERIRDIIIAKQKRKGAKALTKTLLAIRPILEKKERESEVKKAMKLEAEIKGHNKVLKRRSLSSDIDEETLYMTIAAIGMRMRLSNGKGKRELDGNREILLQKAKENGWATDIMEIEGLIPLIPEEKRKVLERQLTRAIHRK